MGHGGNFIVVERLITILDESEFIAIVLRPESPSPLRFVIESHWFLPFHLVCQIVNFSKCGRTLLRIIELLHNPTVLRIELLFLLGGHHVVHRPFLLTQQIWRVFWHGGVVFGFPCPWGGRDRRILGHVSEGREGE